MLLDEILAHCAKTSIAADRELVVLLSSSGEGGACSNYRHPLIFLHCYRRRSPGLVQTLFSSNIYQNTTHTFFSDRLLLV
ncbi:hypothetical protein HW132_01855 [Brasilonema sp. CT11]|nr:hypothetical protein [Brasilonema sp. CT11]